MSFSTSLIVSSGVVTKAQSSLPRGFLNVQRVKNPPVMQETQETWVQSLDWEDPLEEEMETHSIVKLFSSEKFHGQRNLVGYSPWGHSGWTPLSTHSTADCMPVNYSETNRPSNLILIRICMVIVLCMCVLSHVQRLTLCDSIALQAPLSMQFSRQEYWSGLPFPTPNSS